MMLRDRSTTPLRHPDHEDAASNKGSAAIMLSGISAISGAVVGFLLAGNGYASIGLIVAVLAAGCIGWWARGPS